MRAHPRGARPRRALLLLCVLAVAATTLAAPAAADPAPTYLPPVEAPVLDPFRPPEHPYGPGNRGLLYDTAPGTEVRAAADGEVTFAGLVAGSRHVTVLHADGLRTSYSHLDEVHVVAGQRVVQGQVLGTTVDDLHLGARNGDAYLDPAALFGAGPPEVHLVPFDEPPGVGERGERSALRQLIGGLGGLGRALTGEAAAAVGWLRGEGSQLLRTFGHYATRFSPPLATLDALRRAHGAWERARAAARRPCTPVEVEPSPPAERRIALLVAGLGSTSEHGAIDDVATATLGYAPPDVVRFSYAGGRTPDPTDGFASLPAVAYDAADTQRDLRAAGVRLADLIEDLAADGGGAPIDVLAHSQGGLVARLALVELERRHGTGWLDRLGLVATLGTPHGGADLATGIHAVASTRAGSVALDGAALALRLELDDDGASVAQLAETSDVVAELREARIPDVVDAVSIGARGDLVVPAPRIGAPGATRVLVPLAGPKAHDSLPGSPEATRELSLALAGLPPTCRGLGHALTDEVVGEAISYGEDLLGAVAWAGAAGAGAFAGP